MKKSITFIAAAASTILLASCGSADKMAKMAENVTAKCDPAVLEAVAGEINANVSVTYPAGYFNSKAVVEVTPVLVYEGGEAKMKPFVYQGEKVKDNYKVVSSAGQTVREKIHFEYVEGMEKGYLELRSVLRAKNKSIVLPSRKVADGTNTTYMLVKDAGQVSYKADNYQEVITESAESQIKYKVNSSEVRGSELKSQDIKDFLALLDDIKSNERAKVASTEIVAYASPEGKEDHNNKLSTDRSASAKKAWDRITKGKDANDPAIKAAGEDWEGFKKLVEESNIEDKDLILRVLSMYSDPAVRESEIRNMSQVFTELKGGVLPELRRARLIANIEVTNYTAEELLSLVETNIDVLDEEALLRVATLVKDDAQKEAIYNKAVSSYDSSRAQYNLAVLYLNQNKTDKAAAALRKIQERDADVLNALGVVALRQGDLETADRLFRQAGDNNDARANLGVVDILTGEYEQAVAHLEGVKGCCHNIALAYILTDQLERATKAIHCNCPKCAYLKAIIAARQGDAEGVKENLESATSRDADLAARAVNDIEFAGYEI